jgi:ABC-2 type transport system ATP-binding protein
MERFLPLLKADPFRDPSIELVEEGFYFQGTQLEVARMNRLLVEHEIDIVGIERAQATLEDAFLSRLRRRP